MFTFDVCWDRLGTSIFRKSSSATNKNQYRLLSRLSFRFLWLCNQQWTSNEKLSENDINTHLKTDSNIFTSKTFSKDGKNDSKSNEDNIFLAII